MSKEFTEEKKKTFETLERELEEMLEEMGFPVSPAKSTQRDKR